MHHSDKFKPKIRAVCSIESSRDLTFANEDFQRGATAGGRVAVWPVTVAKAAVTGQTASRRQGPDGCRLVRDGNSAAMPPIAAPEFGDIGKMKAPSCRSRQ